MITFLFFTFLHELTPDNGGGGGSGGWARAAEGVGWGERGEFRNTRREKLSGLLSLSVRDEESHFRRLQKTGRQTSEERE